MSDEIDLGDLRKSDESDSVIAWPRNRVVLPPPAAAELVRFSTLERGDSTAALTMGELTEVSSDAARECTPAGGMRSPMNKL